MKRRNVRIWFAAVFVVTAIGLTACQKEQGTRQDAERHEEGIGESTLSETETAAERDKTTGTEADSDMDDSAAAVAKSSYVVAPGISEQIAVYVANRSLWLKDTEYEKYSYALYDLDRDGQLELMSTICQGTGLFSESCFYRIEDGAVREITQEEALELDMGFGDMQIYRDSQSGEIYYYGSDVMKDGATHGGAANGYFLYDGEKITSVENIRGYDYLYEDEDMGTYTYWDGAYDEIPYAKWEEKFTAFTEGKVLTGDLFFWDRYYTPMDYDFSIGTLSDEELQEDLESLYAQYKEYIAGRDYDAILKKLAGYPSGYRELCKTDVCMEIQNQVTGEDADVLEQSRKIWQQFTDSVEQGTPAQIVIVQYTVEGDPVLTYLDYNGHNIYGITDSTRDHWAGSGCPYYGFTYQYLKAFSNAGWDDAAGQTWALVNREDVTMEELREAGNEELPQDMLDYRIIFTIAE